MGADTVDVCLEVGSRRTFASALDWPGWCRQGGDPDAALSTLLGYAPRYLRVAARAGLQFSSTGAREPRVVETVAGTATTDFGAPAVACAREREPLDPGRRDRLAALLAAAWDDLTWVAAEAPPMLRKGPRGGGRDRDAIVEHVIAAERSYALKVDVHLSASEWRDGHVGLLRRRIGEVLVAAVEAPGTAHVWPLPYVVRRMAWHVLDHTWEIEDRSA